VSRDGATQISSHCSCGSSLRFETRERYGERRSLALCSNADCGVITTGSPDGLQQGQGLESFLLGPDPAQRYQKPWMRLYFKASKWGFTWFPAHETCPSCSGEITVQLGLPPITDRHNDPYQVLICLTCGATGMAWWLGGERTAIAIESSEWNEPSTAVLILRRVLEERAARTREGWTWDFQ
jgi:hypothetical protein